ncbi:hypothetical protein [Nocardia noduli]|uniref:hypothetical protein n=1 Tax=Nocardia noduli TaxID=2815722 RepID=UPI001C24B1A5|nr:hypothetical protein [Nocardia noduli]
MTDHSIVQPSIDSTALASASATDTEATRGDTLLAWALAAGAAVTGPVGGGQLILMSKPIGGVLDIPGAVVGYVVVTAALLGCLTALAVPRLFRHTAARAGAWSGIGAGAALILVAVASEPTLFTAATLAAGALTGIAYTTGRTAFGALGANARTTRHALNWLGLLGAATLARLSYDDPMSGLMVAGVVAAGLGVLAIPLAMTPATAAPVTDGTTAAGAVLLGYAAAGLALGVTVTPALHLLLFRWEVVGVDQMPVVGATAVAALVAVLVPLRRVSVALILVVAAGGPLLVALAPGPSTLAIGLAVTVAAAARAALELDRSTDPRAVRPTALAVCAGGLGAVAGLAVAEALGAIFGAGTALTLTVVPVLAIVAASVTAGSVVAAKPRTQSAVSEGDHS